MAKVAIHLGSGQMIEAYDDAIEEIDDILDRIRERGWRPCWLIIGDTTVFTGAVSAFEIT